ncbi:MAG: hypothetical protein ABJA10_10735 [Aestuariivirga sp.]
MDNDNDNGNIINLAQWKPTKHATDKATVPHSCKDAMLIRAHTMRGDDKTMFAGLRPVRGLDAITESIPYERSATAEQMVLAVSLILIARASPKEIETIVRTIIASGGMMQELIAARVTGLEVQIEALKARTLSGHALPL